MCSPATVPGTPTRGGCCGAAAKSYLPSVSHISAMHRPAPTSRKSKDVGSPVAGAIDHESAAADVAGGRVRHGQRERGRDRGVDGVAAALDDLAADLRTRCRSA